MHNKQLKKDIWYESAAEVEPFILIQDAFM